ncbi:hypothetical protein [Flagellimonas marinaquae]|uniref:hypothetical protein n=1 Tax=Flagellimonas marinaquae TaxID=254955 RepID=UPI000F8E75D8|nr:hypothetical protein [Allomuricauda aquimarina]
MRVEDFEFLEELSTNGHVLLTNENEYAQSIYDSNIPFRPGVYLVYSLNDRKEDQELLYYGKAGVTENKGNPMLNFHQLPKRLVATTNIPQGHPDYKPKKRKDITRARLWPWYVRNIYKYGIKIYWFITEWPEQNPNDYEEKIKTQLKKNYPEWKKAI